MGRPLGTYKVSNENLLKALEQTGGELRGAAQMIGLTTEAIRYRLRREPMLRYKLDQIRGKSAPAEAAEGHPDEQQYTSLPAPEEDLGF